MEEPVSKRPYHQQRRADAAAATTARILDATVELVLEGPEPGLDAIAARAGVVVQTILRKFGSKDGLLEACLQIVGGRVEAERNAVTPGDVEGAIDNLLDHYDAWGERALRLLALEANGGAAAKVVSHGRLVHRAWVERAFGPALETLPAGSRARSLALLVAVTDVFVWKLLHQDQGLDRAETRAAMLALVHAALNPRGGP